MQKGNEAIPSIKQLWKTCYLQPGDNTNKISEALARNDQKQAIKLIKSLDSKLAYKLNDTIRPNKPGWTLLHDACYNGMVELCLELLSHGAYVNKTDATGSTPLHDAVRKGNLKCVKILCEHGADMSKRTSTGETALDIAVSFPNDDKVKTELINTLQMAVQKQEKLEPYKRQITQLEQELLHSKEEAERANLQMQFMRKQQEEDTAQLKQQGESAHSKQHQEVATHSKHQEETAHSKHHEEIAHSKHQDEAAHSKHQEETAHSKHQDKVAHSKNQKEAAHSKHQDDTAHSKYQDEVAHSNTLKDHPHNQDFPDSRLLSEHDFPESQGERVILMSLQHEVTELKALVQELMADRTQSITTCTGKQTEEDNPKKHLAEQMCKQVKAKVIQLSEEVLPDEPLHHLWGSGHLDEHDFETIEKECCKKHKVCKMLRILVAKKDHGWVFELKKFFGSRENTRYLVKDIWGKT